jgi:magnesium chelatase family protein
MLDELPEFTKSAIDSLVVPFETGLAVHRSSASEASWPASPAIIVATANPCACGWSGSKTRTCQCNAATLKSYTQRLALYEKRLALKRINIG